jgi:integrase/recombinase XerD
MNATDYKTEIERRFLSGESKANIIDYVSELNLTVDIENELLDIVTEGEVTAMADIARKMRDGERNELMILVTFQCALRISETLQITKQNRAVTVDGKHRLFIMGKGHKPRVIAIPEAISFKLGDYIGRTGLAETDRVFQITRQRAWKIIKQCAVAAGIEKRVYCHLLRHGGAIARLKRSGNPKSLQIHLGHADFKMTMRYLSTLQVIESLDIEDKVKF